MNASDPGRRGKTLVFSCCILVMLWSENFPKSSFQDLPSQSKTQCRDKGEAILKARVGVGSLSTCTSLYIKRNFPNTFWKNFFSKREHGNLLLNPLYIKKYAGAFPLVLTSLPFLHLFLFWFPVSSQLLPSLAFLFFLPSLFPTVFCFLLRSLESCVLSDLPWLPGLSHPALWCTHLHIEPAGPHQLGGVSLGEITTSWSTIQQCFLKTWELESQQLGGGK